VKSRWCRLLCRCEQTMSARPVFDERSDGVKDKGVVAGHGAKTAIATALPRVTAFVRPLTPVSGLRSNSRSSAVVRMKPTEVNAR
jgi:hypothetical protein